jgi:hypothetical protein
MSVFLKELSGYHRDEEVVLILDKADWHTAANLNIPENITLQLLGITCDSKIAI